MSVVQEDGNRTNIYAKEPLMYYENYEVYSPNEVKERTNGRWAMCGFIAGIVSYSFTGNFFFGVF